MKTIAVAFLSVFFLFVGQLSFAQKAINLKDTLKYSFDTIATVKHTSVKDQASSGTCWSFAAVAFIEAELLRTGEPRLDLSEMYFVRLAYLEKALSFVRLHGSANFGPGGQAHHVINLAKTNGFVLEKDYPGRNYGEEKHQHGELDAVLKAFVKEVSENPNRKLSESWIKAYSGILDAYLGVLPTQVEGKDNKLVTPLAYMQSLKFNPEDYVELTSYNHIPFYKASYLAIPDNYDFASYYNLPIDELMQVIDHALIKGYPVCWDGDVSDKGFSHNNALAIAPDATLNDLTGSEKEKWQKLTPKEKAQAMYQFNTPVKEKEVSQADRQKTFDNLTTTDDHLMLLTGLLKDQTGTHFYITKNSWAPTSNENGGFLNMSNAYLRLNTTAILVHKDALPKEIRKKLNIN